MCLFDEEERHHDEGVGEQKGGNRCITSVGESGNATQIR